MTVGVQRTNGTTELHEGVPTRRAYSTSSRGVVLMPTFIHLGRTMPIVGSIGITYAPGPVVAESEFEREVDEDVRAYVSRLWAEDWDSPEDQIYDRM